MKFFKTKYAAAAFALAALAPAAYAYPDEQELLNEGFDNIAALPGWTLVNNSTPPGTGWFQGNPEILSSKSGAPDAYIAASFLGAADNAGKVDNWLITPTLNLSGTTALTFFTSHDGEPGYVDMLEVRFAPGSGTGTDGFSTLLSTIGGVGFTYPTAWQQFGTSVDFDGPGRFAFRYLGDAAALNYVGIDTVRVVTAVPEPSLYLMLAMGLGALTLMRRKLAK